MSEHPQTRTVDPRTVEAVRSAAARILGVVVTDPRYAHTSHLHIRVAGEVVVEEHLRGPDRQDVFSVTKTVLALVAARIAAAGLLPGLDEPVSATLPVLRGTTAEPHTWRQLLGMTRGCRVGGPWDIDEVTALPGGQVAHIAASPQRRPPGRTFRYDNGASHLVAAALGRLVHGSVADYARRELFGPLGITDVAWRHDPDGVPYGYAHLQLRAADLGRLGQLLLDGGRFGHQPFLDADFLAEMTRVQSPGGPPEQLPYGLGIWIEEHGLLGGGWAGQHLAVVPAASAVVVATGDPGFEFGPPPSDRLPLEWRPAIELVRTHLLPVLLR